MYVMTVYKQLRNYLIDDIQEYQMIMRMHLIFMIISGNLNIYYK